MYNIGCQIRFKTTMLKWRLCVYGDAYIVVKGTIIVPNTGTGVKEIKEQGQRSGI